MIPTNTLVSNVIRHTVIKQNAVLMVTKQGKVFPWHIEGSMHVLAYPYDLWCEVNQLSLFQQGLFKNLNA